MAASNLVLLCKSSGLCAAACNRQEWQQSLCSTPRTAQLLIRHRHSSISVLIACYWCGGWWIHWTMSGLSSGHDVMYMATKILHLGYLFDQAQDMRCIVLPAADCSHEESIQHFEAQSGGN